MQICQKYKARACKFFGFFFKSSFFFFIFAKNLKFFLTEKKKKKNWYRSICFHGRLQIAKWSLVKGKAEKTILTNRESLKINLLKNIRYKDHFSETLKQSKIIKGDLRHAELQALTQHNY